MNNLLNTIAHGAMRLFTKRVRRTEAECEAQMDRSREVASEIADWRGNGSFTVISLGQNCSTAWYIKAVGLKQASYPFDWVATSPDIVMHCLADRFSTFLDRGQMVSRGVRAGHALYHSGFFGHRNPRSSQADYDYYVRCVERFLDLMDSYRPVIFVATVLNEPAKRSVWADGFINAFRRPVNQRIEDFNGMMEAIRSVNPNAKFLFIEEYTEDSFELTVQTRSENFIWVRHRAMGKSTGVKFLDSVDDMSATAMYSALKA